MHIRIKVGVWIVFLLVSGFANAQDWRIPDCRDLEVTSINIDNPNKTARVDVYNNCNTCMQHVYTGLIVYGEKDTLAISKLLFGEKNPDNKSTESYDLITTKSFTIADITKIEMVAGICDSITISNVVLKVESNKSVKFTVFPNPTKDWITIRTTVPFKTLQLEIFDTQGRSIKQLESTSPNIFIGDVLPGIYFISIKAENLVYYEKLLIE